MDDAHRLDGVCLVFPQLRLDCRRIGATPPVGRDELRREAELDRHLLPQGGEVAGLEHEDPVAGRERVDQRRLPSAGAGGRIDHHRLLGLEHVLEPVEHLEAEHAKLRPAMIHRRHVDRAQHAVRHVRRSGDLEEMTAGAMGHEGHLGGGWQARDGRLTILPPQ